MRYYYYLSLDRIMKGIADYDESEPRPLLSKYKYIQTYLQWSLIVRLIVSRLRSALL